MPGAHPAYDFSPLAIAPAVTAAVLMLFAIRVVLTRFSRISMAMLGMAIAAGTWQAAFAFMYLTSSPGAALMWGRIGNAFVPFVAPAVYQFVTTFLHIDGRRKIIVRLAWSVAALLAILTVTTGYLVVGVRRFWWGFYPVHDAVASVPYMIFFGGFLAAAVVEMVHAYGPSRGTERERIRLFTIALAVGYIAAVDFLPAYGVAVYPFGWAALLALVVVVAYAIRKHGLAPITPSLVANEIIGTMRDLLLVTDRDGRIEFANAAAYTFLGVGREEVIGRELEELMVPVGDSESQFPAQWVRDREYVFRTRTGQPIELTFSHSPVMNQGEMTGAVLIGRDLRERKRYEWEARRAVTLLQSTLDSTTDGILVIGEEGRVLTWNQRFSDIWGIPAEVMEHEDHDVIGHLVEQLVDPAEFLRNLESLHAHPEVESFHVLQLKDGRRFEQYSMGRYLGSSPLRVWSFHDVTARMAAEEALRDSEERYRLLFEQNAAGVCVANIFGRIVDCNSTFAEMIGYSEDELTNRGLHDVFDSSAAADEIRRKLEETPTLRGLEVELRRRDGERVSALANVSLLGRSDRALVHMTAVDISVRKRIEQQIEFQAYHDALTLLPNRRLFTDRLEQSLLAAVRARGSVAVLFVDLDRFKTINDTFGHATADALLVEVAQRLRSCVRQTDTVARFGGDEFTIILPDIHQPDHAARVAEKILDRVIEPAEVGGTTIEISVSIGVAVSPFDGTDSEALLRNADKAMYRAKEAGRNNYQLCTEQMKFRAMERLSLQSRLEKAMAVGELTVAYQPQLAIGSGALVGAEALVRWNDPERGLVEAIDFIPIAEETRLILPLGEWVLFTACQQLRKWCDAGMPLRMAVNISSRQFQQRDIASLVRRAVDSSKIDPALLEIELTETTAMHRVEVSIETLDLLRDTGVSIAIDDFGSDYSSLRYLQVLPINSVRIDRRCVNGISTTPSDAAIVGSIIDVGRTLGLRVLAEGVETREQLDFLQTRGCHEVQGFLFSPAVDAESFRRFATATPAAAAARPTA